MKVYEQLKFVSGKLAKVLEFYAKTKTSAGNLEDGKYAVLNLSNFLLHSDMGRYSFLLCQYFAYSGFKIVIKLDRRFFTIPSPYKQLMLKQDFIFVRNANTGMDTIVLSQNNISKTVRLTYGYRLIKDVMEAYYLPYPPHPFFFLDQVPDASYLTLRSTQRKIKIFFAGNVDQKLYSKGVLERFFSGIISRAKMLEHVQEKFKEEAILVTDDKVLYRILDSEHRLNKIIINVARTPQSTWLEILSRSHFFICLPGVSMPWSHNAVEAMSVGTIPIIQYNHLFTPPLEHMKNCISFGSYEEFDRAVSIALSLDEEQLIQLKNGVIEYYDTYLNTNRVVDKVTSFLDSPGTVLNIAVPFLDVNN
jgi:hypothetical protein